MAPLPIPAPLLPTTLAVVGFMALLYPFILSLYRLVLPLLKAFYFIIF